MRLPKKKAVKAAVAGLAASAMLLTAMPAYAGIGSGGGGVHGGGNVGPSGDILYLQDDNNYTDSPTQGWGQASIDYALQAMRNSGYAIPTDDSYAIVSRIKSSCTEAINQAVADKSDGDATQARVIGVAATIADGSGGLVPWGTNPTDFRNRFDANWNALGDKSDDLKGYDSTWVQKVYSKFTDQITTTGNQYPTGVQVVCVAVNNQQPPRDYDLTVTTNHKQRTDLKVGSTDPISDTLHASNSGSSIKENLNGTAIIHYEGQKNGYVAAKTVSKPITFANSGDTQLDRLATPADFGMNHWQEGQYWIDIQAAKQGKMKSAVDTTDKDPAETWNVSAEPPSPPVKTIDEGVSADSMTNRTVITYGTGKGGYEMTLKDKITANGVDCTVDDYKLVDKTDNDCDVSNEFTITWDRKTDTVSAVSTADKGEMPLDHKIEFSFDITVSKPKDFKKVKDHATGKWNQEPEADAGSKEFDARQDNQAYKVWRLGMTDDYDDEYLKLDATNVEITDETGKDVTSKFNIQDKDGVLYAYAKLVDTEIPATGETVKGDPQPEDLKAYSESDEHDPLTQPAIDQTLLGHTYTVTMPMTVIKVTDGYTVKNKATQVLNKIRKDTNEVTNPLKPINPAKDVTVKVGGASANGKSIYKGRSFLYQLDSSILPANRAYPQVDKWNIVDSLDPAFDEYTGQWAVYATRDLLSGGEVLASKGDRIAGSGFDSSKLGGDLFTLSAATVDGRNVVTIEATDRYRALVSDDSHEAGWRAYIQCKRLAVTDRHENQFTEHYNDKTLESNVVWTRTPDMTPSIDVQKWDRKSGWPNGDRDNSKDALTVSGDTEIVFTITNTSKTDPDTKQGAVFRTKDIKLEDSTIVGDGEVVDLKYPADWDTKVLKPGESVEVTGTLKGVTKTHTDRAKVTGTPLTECPVDTSAPFGDGTSDDEYGSKPEAETESKSDDVVTIDGKDYCADTKAESATDDWNGYRKSLAQTGAGIALIALAAVVVLGGGAALLIASRRREAKAPADTEGSEE